MLSALGGMANGSCFDAGVEKSFLLPTRGALPSARSQARPTSTRTMGDKPSKGFKSDGHRLGGAGQDDSSPTKQAPPPKKSVFKKKKAPRAPVDPAERAKQAEERRRAAEQRSNAFDNKLKSQRAKKVGIPLSC